MTGILKIQHHHILPQGNTLPDMYKSAVRLVKDFLVKPLMYVLMTVLYFVVMLQIIRVSYRIFRKGGGKPSDTPHLPGNSAYY